MSSSLSVNQNKLQKRLRRLAGEAIADFNMKAGNTGNPE